MLSWKIDPFLVKNARNWGILPKNHDLFFPKFKKILNYLSPPPMPIFALYFGVSYIQHILKKKKILII